MVGSDPVQSTAGGSIAEAFRAHLVSSGARRPRAGEELAYRWHEESMCDLECEEPLNHSAVIQEAYGPQAYTLGRDCGPWALNDLPRVPFQQSVHDIR